MDYHCSGLIRVRTIAINTLREAVRLKLFYLIIFFGCTLVGGALLLRDFDFGRDELRFLTDFGLGTILLFGSILSIGLTAQLFFNDIDHRTALTVLARPVSAAEFLLGKLCGIALVLLLFLIPLLSVLMAIVFWREGQLLASHPSVFQGQPDYAYSGLLVFGFLQWLRLCLLASITLLICSFARTPVYATIVSFFCLTICQLQPVARQQWAHIESPVMRLVTQGISLIFPNLQLFNIGDGIANGVLPRIDALAASVGYGLAYLIIINCLAILSFKNREF
ncbi:MAG: ABC transporter permease [Verrucomicrobiota bacterium]|nr:ABC transporter permease [Verrucomicrobiota bacterium]